jgi:hypothetical protein
MVRVATGVSGGGGSCYGACLLVRRSWKWVRVLCSFLAGGILTGRLGASQLYTDLDSALADGTGQSQPLHLPRHTQRSARQLR